MSSVPNDFDRSQLKDRKWKGDGIHMNKEIAKSPTEEKRRCTDLLCCFVFVAFLVGMGISTIWGYANGNPGKLIAPIDGDGMICGYSEGYGDYEKLYIDGIVAASNDPSNIFTWGVCVKSCPGSATDTIECVPTTKNSNTACTIPSGNGYGTHEILNYCYADYDTLPQAAKDNWDNVKSFGSDSYMTGAFAEVMEARWVLLLSAVICLVVTLIYIKFMDWCAFWLSWISIFLVLGAMIASGIFTLQYRSDEADKDASYKDSSTYTWLGFAGYMSFIMAGIYILVMICYFQSLRVAIAVIETAADFFADTKRIIFVPMLFFFIGLCAFVAWVAALICVASIGTITVENVETQSKDIVWDDFTTYSMWYMLFGFIWIVTFLIAVNEFIVIVSAITWYYSDKTIPDDDGIPGDSDVRVGFWWSFRYHGGSLAFGSFILAVVWIIKFIFEYVGEKMIDASPANGCTKCLVSCIRCCLDCFDRFIRYLNRNAFIYMALSGEGFCSSALNAFILILKNHAKFAFTEGIADVFMFLAKFFISVSTTAISWLLLGAMTEVDAVFLPLFIIFLLSYMIAAVFIAVFDVSANTILQCYLMDKEIAHQQGLQDPDHIPPTMHKFFKNDAVASQMTKPSSVPKGQDEEKQNLIA